MEAVRTLLQPIADWFAGLNIPQPIVQWGHPAMMGIVIFVMGTFTAWIGWRGRLARDPKAARGALGFHALLAPFLFTFIALGYVGGVLSLVMQDKPIFSSVHFLTGTLVVGLLGANGLIAASGFAAGKLRTIHAYLGTAALALLFIHAFMGLRLGLSL
jgi:magnesium-transporting ATPase (P-type)